MTPTPKPQSTSLRACSACAGEYEDPEQTAWGDVIWGEQEGDDDEGAGSAEQAASREGFPAREL